MRDSRLIHLVFFWLKVNNPAYALVDGAVKHIARHLLRLSCLACEEDSFMLLLLLLLLCCTWDKTTCTAGCRMVFHRSFGWSVGWFVCLFVYFFGCNPCWALCIPQRYLHSTRWWNETGPGCVHRSVIFPERCPGFVGEIFSMMFFRRF